MVAKFSLIDLAGSERITEAEKNPERIDEARFINKSLSALGNVVAALRTQAKRADLDSSLFTPTNRNTFSARGEEKMSSFAPRSGGNSSVPVNRGSERRSFHQIVNNSGASMPLTFSDM